MPTDAESLLTPLQGAGSAAANAQSAEWAQARMIDLPAASAAHAALHGALAARGPRFAATFCSQCGCDLGPGDSGVSSCVAHMRKQAPVVKQISPAYAEFRSEFLGGPVRVGYGWDDPMEHAHYPQSAAAELTEVWIGGLDMGQHLALLVSDILQAELREHLRKEWAL